jgi:hypothetical protein
MRFLLGQGRGPLTAIIIASAAVLVGAAPAAPQVPKLAPHITATVVTRAEAKTLIVRVTDKLSRRPITHAKVTAAAAMRQPMIMNFPPMPLKEGPSGTYRSRYDFLMAGLTVTIRVSGANVVTTTAKFKASAKVPPTLSRVP